MNTETSPEWSSIERITQTMLSAARAGDWEQVREEQVDRDAQLEVFFENLSLTSPQEGAALGARIEHILELDRSLVALSEAAQVKLSEDRRRLQTGRKAHQAYTKAP